jgi:hypothetical protein
LVAFCPVWDRLTQLISQISEISPPNIPLIPLRSLVAIAKKSTLTRRFDKRLFTSFKKAKLFPPPALHPHVTGIRISPHPGRRPSPLPAVPAAGHQPPPLPSAPSHREPTAPSCAGPHLARRRPPPLPTARGPAADLLRSPFRRAGRRALHLLRVQPPAGPARGIRGRGRGRGRPRSGSRAARATRRPQAGRPRGARPSIGRWSPASSLPRARRAGLWSPGARAGLQGIFVFLPSCT